MKALWLAKNRHHPQAGTRRAAPRLSLFPFLAVLICTMGALMLLLLFVTRQARLQAGKEAAAKNAERQSSISAEMEMVEWRVEQLKNSRKATEDELKEARLELGHIEDHGRRLRDQFHDLTEQAKKAAEEGLKAGRFVAAGEEELRQVEGQVAEAQQRLAQAQQAAARRPKSYAIVPYDGTKGTRRRPIYIECCSDFVVLQPEGIQFTEADFDEPLGPGNPLAAAIRGPRGDAPARQPRSAEQRRALSAVAGPARRHRAVRLRAGRDEVVRLGVRLRVDQRRLAVEVPATRPEPGQGGCAGPRPGPPGTRPLDRRRAQQVRQAAAERRLPCGDGRRYGRGRGGRKPRLLFLETVRTLCP